MWSAVFVFSTLPEKNFAQISTILVLILKNLNLHEILNISGNIDSTKKADHILVMTRIIVSRIIQCVPRNMTVGE